MRVLLTLVVACVLLALASSAAVNPPRVQGQAQAQAQQSCTAATINAIRTTQQKLTAIRMCINSKAKVEKLTLHHAGPRVQWTSWQLPGMDPVMNQLGFNAFRYPIAYKSHAKNAAKLAAASSPAITLTPLTPTENACWDGFPVSESGDYNRYNCIAQHRAKYFEGLAVKHKADKSFAKGYAAAKRMGTAKLTAENDVFADSMGAGIYYCPDAKFVREHGDTYSECTFTDASPLHVFNIDEHTPDGKENLEWMEAIHMFGDTAKSKATIRVTTKKFKNRFTNQGEVESVFNFTPTGNIAVRYRAASNTAADQAPYYVLKRFDLKLCKLTGTAAAAPVTTTRRRML